MIKKKLIVLTAPSGAGKTTIARKLLNEFSRLRFSVSATTRPPRNYEEHGIHYYFLSNQEFDDAIENNDFLEWEAYSGNRYGTMQPEVEKLLENGYIPLLDLEINGALNVKKTYSKACVSIFIQPPSLDELEQRLKKRGSETPEMISKRLTRAEKELAYADCFDFNVVNDQLETDYLKVKNIVNAFINDS